MMKLDIIVNSFVFFILGIIIWFLTGLVVGNLEPVVLEWSLIHPKWFQWYNLYQTVYNWTPILILLATVLYIYTNRESEAVLVR